MEPILTITATGFLLNLDGVSYTLDWVGEMLKVSGGDICYYIAQTQNGIEQLSCSLPEISKFVGQN